MNRHAKQGIVNRRLNHGTTIGAVLLASLAVVILLAEGIAGGAGPATSAGKEVVRGEILPVEQTRTLHAYAQEDDEFVYDCEQVADDAAEGFEDYDNTIAASCVYGTGRASQQSSITTTSLSAVGYASADGCCGGGCSAIGYGESIFEVVFDSSATQWCSISGYIATEWVDGTGGGVAEVILTGPGETVLYQQRRENEDAFVEFSDQVLLMEGERYTLRAWSDGGSCYAHVQNEYDVLFKPAAEGDIDGDGDVDTADLLALLGAWGPCEGCPEDIDGNGFVNTADLLILLGNWG